MKSSIFDEGYYRRYYGERHSRVTSQKEIHRLGNFVCSYLKYLKMPVVRVLDVGCGMGYWQAVIERHFPRAEYTGVEFSSYLCDKKGWIQGSVVSFRSEEAFDLVICQGVLQYLTNGDATKAIANLGRLSRGALYLEALTENDWKTVCDQETTDGNTYLRTGDWYHQRLRKSFIPVGGGVFISRHADVPLYEMEMLPDES